ncbi:MAG: hypothetical protein CNF01_06395 [Halieaceae bacterium MED-G27]|jgi:hypothetical protein|nr:hypothetical protein [Halieaceae bacterium]PDH36397.1 MAG: hypothetical protein CNF01_06395 [Halieaceae bacterium MED-G27]
MTDLLTSGVLIGGIVSFIIIEACILTWRHRTTGLGAPPSVVLPNLLAGAILMLGIQLAVWGQVYPGVLICLTVAGLCHSLEYRNHWKGP